MPLQPRLRSFTAVFEAFFLFYAFRASLCTGVQLVLALMAFFAASQAQVLLAYFRDELYRTKLTNVRKLRTFFWNNAIK